MSFERGSQPTSRADQTTVRRANLGVVLQQIAEGGDDLGERPGRGVGEIEDHPEPDELVDERAAEPREAAVLDGAVGERVAAIPAQPRHPHAELPERLGGPELVAELLDALERQHQPDPLAPLDGVEVGGGANLQQSVGALAHGAQEARRLAERLAQRAFRLALELDEDGADLEADTAGFEQREPGARERPALAEAELAVAELEQQVEVSVRNHGGSVRGVRRRQASACLPGLVSGATPDLDIGDRNALSLCDGHTKPAAGLTESTLTSPVSRARA